MIRKTLPVLLTCANSQVGPSVISMLRNHPDYDIRVVGVAAGDKRDGPGHAFCDAFYSVPMGNAPDYLDVIQEIVVAEGIRVLFLGSDEEALALSAAMEWFTAHNCRLACSNHQVNRVASDKLSLIHHLDSVQVCVPQVKELSDPEALSESATELGYPIKPIVIKPRRGRGSRGFRLILPKRNAYEDFYRGDAHTLDLPELECLFRQFPEELSNYFLMAYLPGDKFSTDILITRGKPVCMVTRNNGVRPKTNPPTQLADLVEHAAIEEYAKAVAGSLPFDYFLQVESGLDEHGEPRLIEVNIRLDATLPITAGAGLNFYHEMIQYAMNGAFSQIPAGRIKKGRFVRYWNHLFIE